MTKISHADLLNLLRYDPATGHWFWLVDRGAMHAGDRAGCLNRAHGRVASRWVIFVNGQLYRAARLAWFYVTATWPIEIDHRDGDSTNDRFDNLREANRQQNEVNKGAYQNNSTGIKGVWAYGDKFRSAIRRNGKRIELGLFPSPEAAASAYRDALKRADGDFARVA